MKQICLIAMTTASVWLLTGCFAVDVPIASEADGGTAGGGAAGIGLPTSVAGAPGTSGGLVDGDAAGAAANGGWLTYVAGSGDNGNSAGAATNGGRPTYVAGSGDNGSWAGTAGGIAPWGEIAGTTGGAGIGGGNPSGEPHCCSDGDACTVEACPEAAVCVRTYGAPGEPHADSDQDGFAAGCGSGLDCVDSNPAVHPRQTDYFERPFDRSGVADWDYDCDDRLEHQFTARFTGCVYLDAVDLCVGDGWRLAAEQSEPTCGSGGAFAFCRNVQGKCVEDVIMLSQHCR